MDLDSREREMMLAAVALIALKETRANTKVKNELIATVERYWTERFNPSGLEDPDTDPMPNAF